jgi:hypothetical protein
MTRDLVIGMAMPIESQLGSFEYQQKKELKHKS